MPQMIPVVVAGGNLNGLGVVRSLARQHIPTYLMAMTRGCPAAWSRHATFVRAPRLQGEEFVDALVRLATQLKCRPVLVLTQDSSVLTVSAHRQTLEPFYHINLPDGPIVEALSDKLLFDALAARENFPVPRSCAVRCRDDLRRIDDLLPPVILKPAKKGRVLSSAAERAVRADTVERAREIASEMLAHVSALIVQEWIEGPDSEIYFTFFCVGRDGQPTGLFSGRKLQSSPPAVGSTAICIPAPDLAETLERLTLQFLQRVPYRGLGSLEFKREVRTGQLLMVEPTVGRTDWQEEIATLCGVNLPAIAYWRALGGEPPRSPLPVAAHRYAWRAERQFRLHADLRADIHLVDGYFRWSDPLPGLYHYGYTRAIQRVWRRIRRMFFPAFKHQRSV